MRKPRWLLTASVALGLWAGFVRGQVPGYADLYSPLQVRNLNLQMAPADFTSIKNDATFELEVPAYFWADGEHKIIVSARRKSVGADGDKIALKIDVNQYFDEQQWHGVKKLSLENGFEKDPVSEGFAWYLHRVAAATDARTYGYRPGLASWVNVTLNGAPLGVYVNVEQPDKTFLRNRNLWATDKTWLYKQGELGPPEFREGPGPYSPQVAALDFQPFDSTPSRPAPSGAALNAELRANIDMRSMLTLAAAEQFSVNSDALFSKGKNCFFADWDGAAGGLRMYLPWDQDSVLSGTNESIWGAGPYASLILSDPVFRAEYRQIMADLLDGPLSVSSLHAFLNSLETVLTPALLADPYSRIGSTLEDIQDHFSSLRSWVTNRRSSVLSQLAGAGETVPEPATALQVALAGLALAARRFRGAGASGSYGSTGAGH